MEEDFKQHPTDLIKVVLFGPESTGKTTLSRDLAEHYKTEWVPEYAREYLQVKWDREGIICEVEDLIPIAKGQIRLENELSKKAEKLLICDTDLLETKVYSEEYYDGFTHPMLDKYARLNKYDLYLLAFIDVPWEEDDLRDRPHQREQMFQAFEQALIDHQCNYVILKGDRKTRMRKAIAEIDKLLDKKA